MFPLPEKEDERIVALRAAHILNTGPAPEFDAVVTLVSDLLNVPICLISLMDHDRQWFKAKCGMKAGGTSRDVAFCAYSILSDDVLVIEDAASDPRFKNNPLVTGDPHIRFYAGAPLLVSPGIALGTLCVISPEPRALGQSEKLMLQRFAKVVTGLIRGHQLAHDTAQLALAVDNQNVLLEEQARDLKLRERRFLQTERIARVGGWELDLATNMVNWSHETYRIYDIPTGTPISLELALSAYSLRDQDRLSTLIARMLKEGAGYDEEFEFTTASGSSKWVRTVGEVEFHEGVPKRIFGTFQDITERRLTETRLWRAANRDSLTGLANRNCFDDLLAAGWAEGAVAGMLMVDADHLKDVNDTLGHDAGDELIRNIAQRLRNAAGEAGTLARVGGDEFAILVPAPATAETLESIANDILSMMKPWLHFKGNTLKPVVSIGGALSLGRDGNGLRQAADLALYQAKATCRGGYVPYHDHMKSVITTRTVAVNTVDEALIRGDVLAWYQPVVEVASGRISGLEALARVRCGEKVRSIGEFAEALQDRRTATRLTACMLKRVEADVRAWRAAGVEVPRIGFNVGALDFEEDLETMVLSTCERAGIEPSKFALEVTESVFLSRSANIVSETAARLRARGMIIALDDFGTGHASLAHLGTFPVDVIKMDRSFVMRMNDAGPGAVIAAALIDLAHKLDIQVIAEGVEQDAQLDHLIALGCEKVQGYLFSRPLPPSDIMRLVTAFRSTHRSGQQRFVSRKAQARRAAISSQ